MAIGFNPITCEADILRIEETPLAQRNLPETTYALLAQAALSHRTRNALTFLPDGLSDDTPRRFSYEELFANVNRAARALSTLGVRRNDAVSLLLPNLPETHFASWGAQTVGICNPVNPFLEPEAISGILRTAGSKVLVTICSGEQDASRLKTIATQVPTLESVLLVDEAGEDHDTNDLPDLGPGVQTIDFTSALANHSATALKDQPSAHDVASYFHTGGTTGLPKLVRQTHANQTFMAFIFRELLGLTEEDRAIGGLPLFHVNANYSGGLANFIAGAAVVMAGPQGFRNKKCVQDFWNIVDEHRVTWVSGVPTFYSALLEIPTGTADISSLRLGVVGAAPASPELFHKVQANFGIELLEGYGLSEGTCVSSINPARGEKRIGSIGMRIPYQDIRAFHIDNEGCLGAECATDEPGVLCIRGPNVFDGYLQEEANQGVLLKDGWLNTGDIGRRDKEGYFWLTGRAKDLIIRGGHNIDPKTIEDALARHSDVALVAAIGQPDSYAGELPCAYVTLNHGATATLNELQEFARREIAERAAVPVYIELIDPMPMTAVGKIFKPELRRLATERVIGEALAEHRVSANVNIIEIKGAGLKVLLDDVDDAEGARSVLDAYSLPYSLE